jgi:hypothetical protein
LRAHQPIEEAIDPQAFVPQRDAQSLPRLLMTFRLLLIHLLDARSNGSEFDLLPGQISALGVVLPLELLELPPNLVDPLL